MNADQGAWRAPGQPYTSDPHPSRVGDHLATAPVGPVETDTERTMPGLRGGAARHRAPGAPPSADGPPPDAGVPGDDDDGGSGDGGGRRGVRRRPPRSGRPADPRWARPALGLLLAATAVLYLWGLSASGYANSFYAAAVQAGTISWKAMFFGSLDASNYITVDKPPASLWLMEISGRVFGFSSWSMLVPEALCGVASVGLLYATVRRVAGPAAGLLAGAALALTPVATLMFRFNNPDALLVLLLVLAAYCVTRALEAASWRWLAIAGTAIGFAFLTKMLQAFLVVPGFAVAYLACAPTALRARIGHVLASGAGIVLGAGWWVLATLLVPADSRPYFGGSGNNSVLGLAFGYNGLGRIFGGDGNGGGGGRPGGQAGEAFAGFAGAAGSGSAGEGLPSMPGGMSGGGAEGFAGQMPGGGGGGGGGFGGSTGLTRMFGDNFGTQISWLLPAALVLLVGGLWVTRRAPRTDRTRAALLVWGGWTVVTAIVFSYMEGTIHEYYSVALAPGIAATVAVGAAALWRDRADAASRAFLAAALGVSAIWEYVLLGRSDWQPWLRYPVLLAGLLAAGLVLAGSRLSRRRGGAIDGPAIARVSPLRRTAAVVAIAAAAFGTLAAPAAYALQTASTAHTGSTPTAGPTSRGGAGGFGQMRGGPGGNGSTNEASGMPGGFGGATGAGSGGAPSGAMPGQMPGSGTRSDGGTGGTVPRGGAGTEGGTTAEAAGGGRGFGGMGMGGESVSAEMTKALTTNAGLYRWVAAVSSSQSAASLELATGGLPVMAIGGFTGSDEAITLEQFQQYVKDGKIHYYVGGGGGGGMGGGNGVISQISAWVAANYAEVAIGGETVYDLSSPLDSTESGTTSSSSGSATA